MIDTHAHYDYIKFDGNRNNLLTVCYAEGIDLVINPAISIESNEIMKEKLASFPWIYYGVGIHPKYVGDWNPENNSKWRDIIKNCVDKEKVIAIGETGLDYSRQPSNSEILQQKMWFRSLIELSHMKKLPLILHIRDATSDAIEILREYPMKYSGVVHCFHENLDIARIYVEEMGLYLGIGGKVTYPEEKDLREAVTKIGLEHILLETDAPYIRPYGCQGKYNTSLNLPKIVETIAELKGISKEEVIKVTTENVRKLFNIEKRNTGRIYLTGDTHGGFRRLETFCRRMQTTRDDVMIILGDAGVNYSGLQRDIYKKQFLSQLPITVFCIQGNHEQRPTHFPVYCEQKWHGGTVWADPEFPNILFAKDGEIYDFNGKKAIAIGGAYSVDKMWRITRTYGGNPEWWEDEQPSAEIKQYVERQLEAHDWKIDIVLTHTVPLSYEPVEVFLPGIDQSTVDKSTEEWLETLEQRLTYESWYAGHYHTEKKVEKLRLMFEDYTLL